MGDSGCATVVPLCDRNEHTADALRIGGFVPLSSVDYPGMLAAVVFCQGCPWACRYCHNPHLIPAQGESALSFDELCEFLRRRQGLLDAVVFSGGEATFQKSLIPALKAVRALGFRTALHTGGAYPELLKQLLPLVDWVGFDVKALVADYPALTGVPRSGIRNWQSLMTLLASGLPFEARTSWHTELMSMAQLRVLATQLAVAGVKHYSVQVVRGGALKDETLGASPWSIDHREFVHREIAPLFQVFSLRED
ncbi:MAG: anaerobic ribonucleoside-triphosphate reductase activating protein [Gammaproteobacteria bacterium]|nr:anaerobic ribonucleoside-triphosphate reductase activating protein [Gammaproteobacteria bacterium]